MEQSLLNLKQAILDTTTKLNDLGYDDTFEDICDKLIDYLKEL